MGVAMEATIKIRFTTSIILEERDTLGAVSALGVLSRGHAVD